MFDMFGFVDNNYLVEDVEGRTLIQVPMPGVTKEDLQIEAAHSVLDIKIGNNKKLPFLPKRHWRFTHRLGTPEVSAKVENGVLTVTLNETSRSKYRVEVS